MEFFFLQYNLCIFETKWTQPGCVATDMKTFFGDVANNYFLISSNENLIG